MLFRSARARQTSFAGDQPGLSLDAASSAAERAVAVAPHLGDSWMALANVKRNSGDLPGAGRAVREALIRAPSLPAAQEMAGMLLLEAGCIERGLEHLAATRSLDPGNPQPRWDASRGIALLGRWDEADRMVEAPVGDDSGRAIQVLVRERYRLWRRSPVGRTRR